MIPRFLGVVCVIVLLALVVHGLAVLAEAGAGERKMSVQLLAQRSMVEKSDFEEYIVVLELSHPDWAELVSDDRGTLTVELFSGASSVLPGSADRSRCLLPKTGELEFMLSTLPLVRVGSVPGARVAMLAGYKDCREVRVLTARVILKAAGRRIVGVSALAEF